MDMPSLEKYHPSDCMSDHNVYIHYMSFNISLYFFPIYIYYIFQLFNYVKSFNWIILFLIKLTINIPCVIRYLGL